MSLLGKILAFLNILGMAGLMFLAMMDYTKHKEWLYANYRRDLLLIGLPMHKEETDPEDKSRLLYENINPQIQKELFPNNPVTTQKEEVERVKKALDAQLNAEPDKTKQTALLATLLLPLAHTNGERERLLAIREKPAEDNNEELKKQYDHAFKQVLDGQFIFVDDKGATTATKKMSDEERKDAAADLLFALVEVEKPAAPDAQTKLPPIFTVKEYQRYLNVVGLMAADRAMNRQFGMLTRILEDVKREHARDRDEFAAQVVPLIQHIKEIARNVDGLKVDVAREMEKVRQQKVLVGQREEDVKKAEAELKNYRMDSAAKLAQLRQLSDAVFDMRVQLRDKTVSNQENVRLISELEGWRWVPFVGGKYLIKNEEP